MQPFKFATPALLLASFLVAASAAACINETGTNRRGEQVEVWESAGDLARSLKTPSGPTVEELKWARKVISAARAKPDFDNLNELGVVLMHLRRPNEAAQLLEVVERQFPGHWESAPNLGTAYELAGDNRRALRWIREGMRRNPTDHGGSEWLHAAILETKLNNGQQVLNLDFGGGPLPRIPARLPAGNDGKPVDIENLALALRVQLQERAQFVAAPEPIMAGLLFDSAQVELVAGTMEAADTMYAAAERYGYPDRDAMRRGRAEAARIVAIATKQKS